MTAPLVVLASGKGGTGKTTLALALAAAWRTPGRTVGLVDGDAQAGATRAAGITPPPDPLTADPLAVHGLTLWRGGRALADATTGALAARLTAAAGVCDVVVVDASPAITDAGHAAAFPRAAVVLVVARCDAAGLAHAEETVSLADADGVPVVRIVPTFAGPTTLAREALAWMRGRFGDRVTLTTIPADVRAAEAPGKGAPVLDTAPRSRVSQAVRALADELAPVLFPSRNDVTP